MTRLKWQESYSVGDAEIDRQHQNLFSLIDRLEDRDLDVSTVSVIFEKLDTYVEEHFSDEEDKLAENAYPDLEPHIRQHHEFRDWLEAAKESFQQESSNHHAISQNVHDFLRDWLLNHILTADQAYKEWMTSDT
ncbi:bacteriohemerythrin [Terasakiella sp. SH-1]|uniref:bacteriohemerythrin n=1 Tax=Terasakiella sp. SH-1 TaxID=2560057 RepID=UPI001073C4F1|nr:bacteriohemerythrin [Terasakiella sp. SH-1]